MSDRPMVSAAALTALSTWLPSDLTDDQAQKVIGAATEMAKQVWAEATDARAALERLRREFRDSGRKLNDSKDS
jgi:cell division septum initiation protein DivIVA